MNETGPAEQATAPVVGASPVVRLRQRLAMLSTLGQALAHPRDLDQLFHAVYRETARVLDATGFLLGLYDAASQTVEIVRQMDSGTALPGGSFPLGEGFTSRVIRTRQSRLIRRWSAEEPPVRVQYATDRRGLPESGVTVPLLTREAEPGEEAVLGVLSVQSYRPDAYDEDDLLTLQAIAGQTAAAVDALRRSERLDAQLGRRVSELETVLASMADALVIVDAAGGIVQLNEAARTLLGLEQPGVILGQALDRERWGQWPLGGRAVAEALGPMIEALRRGEVLREVEVEVELAGPGRRVVSFSGAPLPAPGHAAGRAAGGVIVFRDVTAQRDGERLKDEVLSIASHDLRTPLTVIRGFAELLRAQTAGGRATAAALGQGLAMIESQADRLEEWLHLLLDLTRMKGGRVVIDPRPTDLVALARRAVADAQAMAPAHHLVLHAPASLEGRWDRQRLQQVLQNLLTNAVKYAPQGGAIEVTLAADDAGVTLRVRDEGVGLAPEELARIFERFYRASGIRQLEGSGLGLYICQGIVTAHGGRIWAESAGPGRGSTFCVRLPVQPTG